MTLGRESTKIYLFLRFYKKSYRLYIVFERPINIYSFFKETMRTDFSYFNVLKKLPKLLFILNNKHQSKMKLCK